MNKYSSLMTLLFSVLVVSLLTLSIAQAQTSGSDATPTPRATNTSTAKTLEQAQKLDAKTQKLNDKANKEIDRRVADLTKLIDRINAIKKLSADSKTTLTTQIQAEIKKLNDLKTKIASDTDIATLRVDVKSIKDSFRIYALFVPKTHILVRADIMTQLYDQLTALSTKLQTRIDAAKSQGSDVTTLETALADLNKNLADAKKKIDDAIALVLPLDPAGYPDNKTTLQNARGMLDDAHHSFQTARQDAVQIIVGLKALEATPSPSSVSTSSVPTVTPTCNVTDPCGAKIAPTSTP